MSVHESKMKKTQRIKKIGSLECEKTLIKLIVRLRLVMISRFIYQIEWCPCLRILNINRCAGFWKVQYDCATITKDINILYRTKASPHWMQEIYNFCWPIIFKICIT